MKTRLNLVGEVFGRLKVVGFAGLDANRNSRWLCVCECGTERVHAGSNLKRGNIVSCGCRKREKRVEVRAEDHPDFQVFTGMLSRCHNPRAVGYTDYGGRGVVVCDRWREGGFWVFNADMGDRPSPSHSIDRVNNDGPYSPDNCRWVTAKEQARNRRGNKNLTHGGVTMTMAEWAERTGINYRTLKARVRNGWSVEQALNPNLASGMSAEQMVAIRQARATGLTMRAVATQFGVSVATVHRVCVGSKS